MGESLMRQKQLGELIKRARIAAKLAQDDIGAAIGADQSTISDWENGKGAPDVFDLLSIARITSRGLSYFIPEYDSRLTGDEQALLQAYRQIPTVGSQRLVLGMILSASPSPSAPPDRAEGE